ncbi:uncharacterized protein CFAP97D2-like [Leptopilina heterotoma]|uniref:uncharacterized protein CFAP97D2-like n=1 Tax=Leptopilina heterotoma TaxID=63436 RepID=UPI001CA9141E|nr:uncharacterized protein CFAP97D2-like [Leptopilina heterotoma]
MPTSATKFSKREIIPVGYEEAYQFHRIKVRLATPTVNMNPPKKRPHILFDAKKLQLERERQARIVRENFILLQKLQSIMYGNARKKYPLTQKKSACIRTR